VRENERALELSNIKFRVGTIDLSSVQQQQIAATTRASRSCVCNRTGSCSRVNLHLALGGSFEPASPPATKTSDASSLRR
jgi:hypothetical protein